MVENGEPLEPRTRRVLVVEDDEGLNNLVQKTLREAGFDTEGVTNGAEAIEHVTANPEVSLLLDIRLPDMAGGEIINTLVERDCLVPFIVMTGQGNEKTAVEMMKLGANDYLVKGLDLTDRLPGAFGRLFREMDTNRQLRAAEETIRQYSHIVANSKDMLALLDQRYVYLAANAGYHQAFGKALDELIGQTVADVFGEEFFKTVIKPLAERCLAGEEIRYQEWFEFPAAGRKYMDVAYSPYRGPNNEVRGFVVSARDITEQKQAEGELEETHRHLEDLVQKRTTELALRVAEAEELNSAMVNVMEDLRASNLKLEATGRELVASNKELDAFSYSVSHDLRAPLRHVDGFVTLLLKREEGRMDPTSSRYLETIAEASNRMGRLIDDLLDFSRTGRTEVQFESVDSNEVIRDIRTELSPLTEGRHVTWEVGDLPAVRADRNLLRLVWENLIGNAIKYTGPREDARIQIGTMDEGVDDGTGEIAFFVRDNGVGFDPQYTHKLFGVFQRLHRDDEFEGTGIGLATVQRIVHRHGGRVWAEGEVDRGATFYFTLKAVRGDK